MDVGNLISGSCAFFKSSLNIWKFMAHVLLKPHLENFEQYFSSMWAERNYVVIEYSLVLPFFGVGMKTDLFQSCSHCWVFQICCHIEHSTLTVIIKMAGREQSILKSNLIPARDSGRAQTKPYVPQDQEKEQWPPEENETDLLLTVWGSLVETWVRSGLWRGQGLWQQQSWEVWCVAYVLLEEAAVSPAIVLPGGDPQTGERIY